MNDLVAKVDQLREVAKRRSAASGKVIQLPLWGDDKRGIPNEIVRSALFTARNRKHKREYMEGKEIAVLGNATLTYRGEELRTDDEDVWLQLMHLVREQPLGEWVEFSPYSLLKAVGWATNGRSYNKLKTIIGRMQATALSVHSKRLGEGVSLSLVRRFEWKDGKGESLARWRVWVEPEMKQLYGDRHYTRLEWERRQKLSPLAKRLYDYYASHAQPYPVKITSLQSLCGTQTSVLKRFKQTLTRALDELHTANLIETWRIDKGLVHVRRLKADTEIHAPA